MPEKIFSAVCNLHIAGSDVSLAVKHPDIIRFFGNFLQSYEPLAEGRLTQISPASRAYLNKEVASIPENEWMEWLQDGGSDDAYGEFTCSTAAISDALLNYNRCIMHAAAIRYKEKAWLISGPSGAGKSTQVRNLQLLGPEEFSVICGDRPALQLLEDGTVFVHPSPWNGKENWKGADGAPLGGLILLKRGNVNNFAFVPARNAVFEILSAVIRTGETEHSIYALADFTDRFLKSVPVYRLTSFQVPDSTKLLYRHLFQEAIL